MHKSFKNFGLLNVVGGGTAGGLPATIVPSAGAVLIVPVP